jgi:ketosteroid isomerase-like protein
MSHLTGATLAARLFLASLICAVALALSVASPVAAQDDLQAEGQQAVQAWVDAVVSGDVARIEALLAPHFQILRADGTAYDKESYLRSDLPSFPNAPEMSELVVTRNGDVLVARYVLTTGGVREGVERPLAPRLTVFQKDGDRWLVVAHANFAALER